MRIPVDTQKVQVLATGQPFPVLDFTTKTPKLDPAAYLCTRCPWFYRAPGERSDPTTTNSVASTAPPSIKSATCSPSPAW